MPQFVNMSMCVPQEFETTQPPATQPKHASQNGYMIIHVSAQYCKHTYIYIYIKYLILNLLLLLLFLLILLLL